MRRGGGLVERIDRHRPEHAEFYRHRFLERGAAFGLGHIMGERRPWRRDAGAFGLGRGGLRLGAANRGDAAFAARDALRRLVQIADRALAADRAVIGMLRLDAETLRERNFRIAVAPAQEIDDVERADLAQEFCAAVGFRAPERLFQQDERFEAFGDFLRAIDDFSDADDDGNAVVGDGGSWIGHLFLVFTFQMFRSRPAERPLCRRLRSEAKQSISTTRQNASDRFVAALLAMRSEAAKLSS